MQRAITLKLPGTALIAYGILKAVRLGYLSEKYLKVAVSAFNGIIDNYLTLDDEGHLTLDGICLVAGLGGNQHRDGSLEYYFSEPVVRNEAKGVAPFLLAYTEILQINK
jgi:Predicted unsaturated glucuronyl hydrolase involved in regulation of bacterial surface properties, and related proteins